VAGEFDSAALVYPWKHSDPEMDFLAARVFRMVSEQQARKRPRAEIFAGVAELAGAGSFPDLGRGQPAAYVDEPWYCCAEPLPV
jgi:hypothetical protein